MSKHLLLILMLFAWRTLNAQNEIIEKYVHEGLENNLALKQQQFSLQKSLQALKEARGMFLPAIGIEARYSKAGGGRLIDIPVGDLMNPVYHTLNQILQAVGEPPAFPAGIENQTIPFLREQEHETKIRLIQPIFQPAIYYKYKIMSNLNHVRQAEMATFKRQLIGDIKKAYFNYLKAARVIKIYDETYLLLKENLRVSEKLFQHHKATEEVVFRAKAEIAELQQQQAEAEKNMKLAAAYFNFLINRPLDSPIESVNESLPMFETELSLPQAEARALEHRVEFQQLQSAIEAAQNNARLSISAFLPGVTGVFDYGFQGEKYKFTEKDDFWMGSIVLHWNLFNGFQDKSKHEQALLEKNKLTTQLMELEAKIKLQVQEAYDNLIVARKSIVSADERLNSARESFRIVSKKYEQGMVPQIEYTNARTMFTNAEINKAIARYDYHVKFAVFEQVAALQRIDF